MHRPRRKPWRYYTLFWFLNCGKSARKREWIKIYRNLIWCSLRNRPKWTSHSSRLNRPIDSRRRRPPDCVFSYAFAGKYLNIYFLLFGCFKNTRSKSIGLRYASSGSAMVPHGVNFTPTTTTAIQRHPQLPSYQDGYTNFMPRLGIVIASSIVWSHHSLVFGCGKFDLSDQPVCRCWKH